MTDLNIMDCLFGDIVVFEVDYWNIGKFDEDFATSLSSVLETSSGSIVFWSGVLVFFSLEMGFNSLNSK